MSGEYVSEGELAGGWCNFAPSRGVTDRGREHKCASWSPRTMPRRTQQAIGAPAPRVFVPAGGGKASLQVVCNPGRLSRYASPAEAQRNKSLRLEVEVRSAPP